MLFFSSEISRLPQKSQIVPSCWAVILLTKGVVIMFSSSLLPGLCCPWIPTSSVLRPRPGKYFCFPYFSVLVYVHACHRAVKRRKPLIHFAVFPEESACVGRVGSWRQTLLFILLWSTCLTSLSVKIDKIQLTSKNINKNFSKSYLSLFWKNSSQSCSW